MKVLDTDILMGILRKNKDAIRKYEQIEEEVSTTIFNAQELLFVALISENARRNFKAAKALLAETGSLPYEMEGMLESIKIQAYLEKNGQHIGLIDEMIAGICIANDADIVTRNIEHFSRVPGLEIEKW